MSTENPLNNKRCGVTLLIVLALMVMFAMLVTAFMVIVSQNRRRAELTAEALMHLRTGTSAGTSIDTTVARDDELFKQAIERLLSGDEKLGSVLAPHSILENLLGSPGTVPFSGTGAGYNLNPAAGELALLSIKDGNDKPYALRPNILAPDTDGNQEYKQYLLDNVGDVRMNPDYTAPDFMSMFLAWNDYRGHALHRIIPSFHRPQLVKYWSPNASDFDPNELRKYVLRPLPTDHPDFTGSNPAATRTTAANLLRFLTDGPWDVDNDGNGIADGVWLDIGLAPIYDPAKGSYYKPLVSYYVVDMEGRINVNAMSNPELTNISGGGTSDGGMGLGPAELSSELLNNHVLTERYGSDQTPGGTSDDLRKDLLKNHGINYDAYTLGGLVADWVGASPVTFDNWGNREKPSPESDIRNIPYLMNPYSDLTGDKPFQTNDFESLVRSVLELDYARLPHNFRELLGDSYNPSKPALTAADARYSLATRGSDIPAATMVVPVMDAEGNVSYETLEDRILRLTEDATIADELKSLLPEQVLRGEKVNLNQLTLAPNWMTGGLLKEKVRFAQEIFYLMQVLFPKQATQSPESLERFAQWSVNLVDFIDPDDVMTPFIFKKSVAQESITVFDNALLLDKLLAGILTAQDLSDSDCVLIWGFEKPEVALSETFAVHNRNVRNTSSDNDSPQFRQLSRPYGILFAEIHRQGNLQRSYAASSLVEADGTLNLAKRTTNIADPDLGDYIWRLAISEAIKTESGQFQWNEGSHPEKNALQQLLTPDNGIKHPQCYQWWYDNPTEDGAGQYCPDLGVPERFVWFGRLNDSDFPLATSDVRARSFVNVDGMDVTLQHNAALVIGSDHGFGGTWAPPSGTVIAMFTPNPTGIPNLNAVMNASEPLPVIQGNHLVDGYTEKGALSTNALPFDEGVLRQRGTVACFKTMCLQRLADPNRAHHSIGNPYITVDWNMIDLQVINSTLQNPNVLTEEPDIPKDGDNIYFSSRRWKQAVSGFSNLWDRTLQTIDEKAGLEFGTPEYYDDKSGLTAGTVRNQPSHSLGTSNFTPPFLHFPWHDAPLMNTGELMLVPTSAPGRIGVEFHDNDDAADSFYGIYDWLTQTGKEEEKPRFGYHYDSSTFSPYPNWASNDSTDIPAELISLFDFVYVPTKFAGTRADDETVYREPGKFNLNTITEAGWEALANGKSGFPSYDEFCESRRLAVNAPLEFRPFRSPLATNLVPPLNTPGDENALVGTPTNATTLGLDLIDNKADNPYLALRNAALLSDVTTTRSNVFAVWMTIGYFEVEKFENLNKLQTKYGLARVTPEMFNVVYPDGYVLGAEKGLDSGTVRRHRAFYLIDRSAPVNFQRGKKLDDISDVIIWETPLD